MLRDKNGEWVEILEITDELWKKIMQETIQGVLKLLESAEILLDNGGNQAICAGLYTYAVEEYGKILLLKQYNPSAGKVKIKYKNEFMKHKEKFRLAMEKLPIECRTIGIIGFEQGFDEGFERIKVISDFEARKAVFYSDFVDSGDGIKSIPYVDKTILKNAINILRTHVFRMNVNT